MDLFLQICHFYCTDEKEEKLTYIHTWYKMHTGQDREHTRNDSLMGIVLSYLAQIPTWTPAPQQTHS